MVEDIDDFNGRRVLVTGGSRGLGAGLVDWLISSGAVVMSVGRSQVNAPANSRLISVCLDLVKEGNVRALTDAAIEFKPDSIVHCLGGGFKKSADLISAEDFLYLLKFNFLVALQLNNALLGSMVQKRKGWIVHVGSLATKEVTASLGYTCVKSLILPYVRHLGKKYITDDVYISGVTLGALSGYDGAMDRLHAERRGVFDQFLATRRPTQRCTPIDEVLPYFRLLLSRGAKLHASNMLSITEAEGYAI